MGAISKPFISQDDEMNKLINWIIRNFQTKTQYKILDELSGDRKILEGELKYEDYQGQERLILNAHGKKYIVNLTLL